MSADPPLDNDLLTPSLAWPRQSDSGFSDTAPGGRQSHQQLESYDEGVDNREVTNDTQKVPQTNLQQVQSRNINDRGNGRPIRGLTKCEVEEVFRQSKGPHQIEPRGRRARDGFVEWRSRYRYSVIVYGLG
jgi:hypothetical protein